MYLNLLKNPKRILMFIVCIPMVFLIAFGAGKGLVYLAKEINYQSQIQDYEHWHGVVSEKKLDQYQESYSCNCRTVNYTTKDSNGKKVTRSRMDCDTCYREVFDTYLKLSTGDKIYYDRGKGYFGTPNPSYKWQQAKVGDPCAIRKSYKNYLKDNRDSTFGQDYTEKTKSSLEKYKDITPSWPEVYEDYKINQVWQILPKEQSEIKGFQPFSDQQMSQLNQRQMQINAVLNNPDSFEDKKIKEVSSMTFFVPDEMLDFYLAVEEKWEGINKNELMVYINLTPEKECKRVQVQSWSVKKYEIENRLDKFCYENYGKDGKNLQSFEDVKKMMDEIETVLKQDFDRKEMQEFEYINQENRYKRELR